MQNDAVLSEIFDVSEALYREMADTVPDPGHAHLYGAVTALGKTLAGSEQTRFWKWDKRRRQLWTAQEDAKCIVMPEGTGLVWRALTEHRIILSASPETEPGYDARTDRLGKTVPGSILILPVANVNGEFIGAFQAMKRAGLPFGHEDLRRLSLAAVLCGIAQESENFLEDSYHDRLTGLKNRMGFYSDFSRAFSKQAEVGVPMSLFICDIDKFKQINDTYGHNAGDAVLQHTAEILLNCCESDDGVYRWGGEEFVMLLTGADGKTCAEKAEKIRQKIMDSVCRTADTDIRLTLSFGAAEFDPKKTVEENISAADEKLYFAKETGRNKVVY